MLVCLELLEKIINNEHYLLSRLAYKCLLWVFETMNECIL